MKQLIILTLALVFCLGTQSCRRELYKRPVTIDKLEFSNKAGEKYEEQFQKVNRFFVQRIKVYEQEKKSFKLDTTASKRYRKYNHTLVASLDSLEIEGKQGVYYQLYLRPNSGIGKIKGGVQEDKYNELKLYSPEHLFLQHKEQFYTDSIVAGPFSNIIVTNFFLPLENKEEPGILTVSIDSINFGKGFSKRQREGIMRILHNSVILEQRHNAGKDPKKSMVFNYYPNFRNKYDKKPASFVVNLDVSQDPISNRITVKINNTDSTINKFWTEAKINRLDYMNGHDYEAKSVLDDLLPRYLRMLYRSRQIQSKN